MDAPIVDPRRHLHLTELPRQRRGSKPARDSFDGYPNRGRAEFFALPCFQFGISQDVFEVSGLVRSYTLAEIVRSLLTISGQPAL
jgi:hypothetical protein